MARQSETHASSAVRQLERAWEELRRVEPEIPPAIMVVQGARESRRGHFATHSWWRYDRQKTVHEMGLSPGLFDDPEELLACMLHEAAHAILFEAGDRTAGGGKDRYYHSRAFRDACLRLGLACSPKNRRYGFTSTYWPRQGIPPRYRNVLRLLREMPPGTAPARAEDNETRPRADVRLVCGCPMRLRREVYVNRSVMKQGKIRCDMCGQTFRMA